MRSIKTANENVFSAFNVHHDTRAFAENSLKVSSAKLNKNVVSQINTHASKNNI
jgi:hypothetical protein